MGNARNIAFWVVLFLLILALFNLFGGGQSNMSNRTLSYSDFYEAVDAGSVQSVTIDGEQVRVRRSDGATFTTIIPEGVDITGHLIDNNVAINAWPQQQSGVLAYLDFIAALHPADRHLDFPDEPDAGRVDGAAPWALASPRRAC